jgi:acyl-coenzyme A synthetase/AMP-(fatty) acid ligase
MSVNSIRNLVEVANAKTPNKVAIIDKQTKLTYAEVFSEVNKLAHYLNTLGLEKGARVGIYSSKNAQKVVSILAVLSTEYILVPITKLLKAEQVEYIINDCGISCMITDEQKLKTLKETSYDGKIITVESCDETIVSFKEIYKVYGDEYDCCIKGHDNAVITYSFASSGFPKGVVISHQNLIDGARVVNRYLKVQEDDVVSGLLSFSFDYGLNQIFTSFYARATFAIHTFFTPSDFFGHLIKDKVSILGAMPVHFGMMFDEDVHRLPAPSQLEHIRVITSSGANVTASMLEKIETYFTSADFFTMSGHIVEFRSAYLDPAQLKIRPNSIGKAIPDVDLYVINEKGYECAPREVGQLIHRGAGIYRGYWNSHEDTANSFKSIKILENVLNLENGLTDEIVVATGDYVYKDEEGYLYYVGRHDDMINTAGYRISPLEVETVVYNNIDAIKECAVFGVQNEKIEEEIVLVYNAASELPKKEILFELKKHLPAFMIPAVIEYRANMPMQQKDRSKIDKEVLKQDITDSRK